MESDRGLSTSLLQAVLEAVADGVLAVDASGRVASWNRKFLETWGLQESALASRRREVVLDAALQVVTDPEAFRASVAELYGHPESATHDIVELKDGRIL